MAISGEVVWDEGPLRAQGNAASTEMNYLLYSNDPANDDREDAYDWIVQNAPDDIMGLRLDGVEIIELVSDTNNASVQEAIWRGRAMYINPSRKKPKPLPNPSQPAAIETPKTRLQLRSGPSLRSASTGVNRLYSEEFIDEIYGGASVEWRFGQDARVNRLLNLKADTDGESAAMFVAQGIQTNIATTEFTVETIIHNEDVTLNSYLVKAALNAGKNVTNDRLWRGFPIRSCKIINVDAKQRGSEETDPSQNVEPWDVVYTIAYSPEIAAVDITLPPGLEGQGPFSEPLRGWDYLDVLYVDEYITVTGSGAKFLVPQARRAAIHRLFDMIDFAAELYI